MKSRHILGFSTALILTVPFVAHLFGQTPSKPSKPASQPIFLQAADVKWTDLDPKGAPGVKIADLWGDHAKGAYGAFITLPAGFTAPLHTHTHAMKVIFLSGTYIQEPEGKPTVRLGPGSYMMQPGGNYRHVTTCDKSADCVFFVESSGAFDLRVVEPPKPPAKK